jgi:hypothetical protein
VISTATTWKPSLTGGPDLEMGSGTNFVAQLSGGGRQSIGEANAVARQVEDSPSLATQLWEAITFPDPVVSMRAVDELEKVSVTNAEVLRGHEQEVLESLACSDLPEVRWHVGLLIPRLRLDRRQLTRAAAVLDRLLDDPGRIVQANALTGTVLLADEHPDLVERADRALSRTSRSPHASVRARARRLTAS